MMDQIQLVANLVLAGTLGALIGMEREWKQKPAGLRTNIIIAIASALFLMLGRVVVEDFDDLMEAAGYGVDPTRVVHAIIVGVSVVGAGTILKREGPEVKYLTTAATILMSSAVGIAVALYQYWLAIGATLLILGVNTLLRKLRNRISETEEPES